MGDAVVTRVAMAVTGVAPESAAPVVGAAWPDRERAANAAPMAPPA